MKLNGYTSHCLLKAAVLVLGLLSAGVASASTYYMNMNNSGLPDPSTLGFPGYATIDITQTNATTIHFEIQPTGIFNTSPFSEGTNFGIQSFYTNSPIASLTSANIANLDPSSWNVSFNAPGSAGPYGTFDISLAGTGHSRTTDLQFDVINSGYSAADFAVSNSSGYYFAAHIADFGYANNCNINSAYFATNKDGVVPPQEVPVPAAVWLFASGLLGLTGIARRRRG